MREIGIEIYGAFARYRDSSAVGWLRSMGSGMWRIVGGVVFVFV